MVSAFAICQGFVRSLVDRDQRTFICHSAFHAMPHTEAHPYSTAPDKTLLTMALPVLISLVAEPLTGLADTAFVARLGAEQLASLGIGTMVLTSAFWVFNFLGVGTQTELARHMGAGNHDRAADICSASAFLALALGMVTVAGAWFAVGPAARAMGGDGAMLDLSVGYMRYRLLGAPAVLLTFACFGTLRGVQDMRAPLIIAAAINGLNIVLDWLLIFGLGPLPPLGVNGAAIATSASQWMGAVWALLLVKRHIGLGTRVLGSDVRRLVSIGGDLFLRTGFVLAFLLLATRVATDAGAESGAAHQAIRQFFFFTALFLDAFAITGQSLIGYFVGRENITTARHVAGRVCLWSLSTGILMMAAMLCLRRPLAWLLVPKEAWSVFSGAWIVAALVQPVNALSFATDGIHWGTGDFKYLRNAMFCSVCVGAGILYLASRQPVATTLQWVWIATGVWTTARAVLGLIRIWPGSRTSPLARQG